MRCPSKYIDYKEDNMYIDPAENDWYKFKTSRDCCGSFLISATDKVELPQSEEKKSDKGGTTVDIPATFSVLLYLKKGSNMQYIGKHAMISADFVNSSTIIEMKYDEEYFIQIHGSALENQVFYHKIIGNTDKAIAPIIMWTRITPEALFPKPMDSLSFMSYSGYIYEKIMCFDAKGTSLLYNALNMLEDILEIPDKNEREEALAMICATGIEDEEQINKIKDFVHSVIVNGTAAIISFVIPAPYALVGGFLCSMVISAIDAKIISGANTQSLSSKIFQAGKIKMVNGTGVAGNPIRLTFKKLFYPQKDGVGIKEILEVVESNTQNEFIGIKYYHGEMRYYSGDEKTILGDILVPSEVQRIWSHLNGN